MTVNDSKSYINYLNKIAHQYNNIYHHSTSKKPIDTIILLWKKKLNQVIKLLNLKLVIQSELLSIRIFLVKVSLKIGQEKYSLSILSLKLILGLKKSKI